MVNATVEPLVVPPSQYWDGVGGAWSTFWVSVGTPPQTLKLLPSTSGSAIWPVLPEGCTSQDPTDCKDTRGGIYNPDQSSTWSSIGLFSLNLVNEVPLGYSSNASYGYDDIRLGPGDASSPLVSKQVLEGFATKQFFIGAIGLSANANNEGSFANSSKSLLTSLRDQNLIPSLSWGYTAGAAYAEPPAFGSLTFGGYDSSRFTPNDVTFPFSVDLNRELLVHIESVGSTHFDKVLSTNRFALLDSLVPDIWLPEDLCSHFETSFGLRYNETLNRYFINETAHQAITNKNVSVSFLLNAASGQPGVNITLPYESFDLVDKSNAKGGNGTRFFPIRQAQNASQYVIGRTFFQNAYVTTDFERRTFSVQQAVFPDRSTKPNVTRIDAVVTKSTSTSKKESNQALGKNATIGVVVAVVFAILLTIVVSLMWWRRRKQKASSKSDSSSTDEYHKPELEGGLAASRSELSHDAARRKPELGSDGIEELVGDSQTWRAELIGDVAFEKRELPGSPPANRPEMEGCINQYEADGSTTCVSSPISKGDLSSAPTRINTPFGSSPVEQSSDEDSAGRELVDTAELVSPLSPNDNRGRLKLQRTI